MTLKDYIFALAYYLANSEPLKDANMGTDSFWQLESFLRYLHLGGYHYQFANTSLLIFVSLL